MASHPTQVDDVEMTDVQEEVASDSLEYTNRVDNSPAKNNDVLETTPAGSSAIPSTEQDMDDDSVDDQRERNFQHQPAPWRQPGWGFDLLQQQTQTPKSDVAVVADADIDDEMFGDTDSEVEELIEDSAVEDDHEDIDDEAVPEDDDARSINDAVNQDAEEDAYEEATDDHIADDVAAQAAAADRAATEFWLAEQDLWLQDLADNSPEEFNRLIASGVVDEDALLRMRFPRNDDDEGNDERDDDDGVAPTDGDDQDAAALPQPAGVAAAAANPPTARPANDGNATTASNTDNFVWLANRGDAVDDNGICPACQTEFKPDDQIVYLDCGHAWCSECLNANYRSALRNRAHWPPRCCHIAISHSSIADRLEPALQLDLVIKMEEFNDRHPIYCQTPKCTGGYISIAHRSGQWASCHICHLSTCIECKAPASAHPMPDMHPSMKDIIEKDDKDLADGAGWKQCPGCRNLVERSDGCDHMMCDCGHSFCYQCGKTLMNGMPCDCRGEQQWVQDMNAEAAAAAARGGGEDDEDGEEQSDDDEEREDEDDRVDAGEGADDDDGAGGGEGANEAAGPADEGDWGNGAQPASGW